ncbi:MAG: AraC family transcriptional regulator ligand-binding domain-containing protein [Pseudomonadales bacterium]|nr:AraC family transcriptional regulator ligand-binding domain-containing protein [Pseudomonadales bacterium]
MNLMPAAYALSLVEYARQQQIDLLKATGISEAELHEGGYIASSLYPRLMSAYDAQSADPGWSFRFGSKLGMGAHGAVGVMALSAATLGEGFALLARYLRTRTPFLTAWIVRTEETFTFELTHVSEMQAVQERASELMSMVILDLIASAIGRRDVSCHWYFPYDAPAWADEYRQYLPGRITFGGNTCRITMATSLADTPSLLRDDSLREAAERRSRVTLNTLFADSEVEDVRLVFRSAFEKRIREETPVTPIPRVEEVAETLGVSPRTLMRRLKRAETNLQTVKDSVMRYQVTELIRRGHYTASEIAGRLGYENPGNFTRACKRMFGLTPQALVARMKASPEDFET